MARMKKEKQENFYHAMLWFLEADPLPNNWEQFRSARPLYFAGKIPTQSGYELQWVQLDVDSTCVPISVDMIFAHLAGACAFHYPDERISEYKMRDLFFLICSTLKTPYFEMTRHRILLDQPIKPIGFSDDDCYCFERIDCPRPRGDRNVQPGQVNFDSLNPYWRMLLQRMGDYEPETDQSAFFEMLLMCLAEAFLGERAPKVVPYIVGPRDAGKTTLMNDIGSLFGRAFAPNQRVDRITHEYFVAELKGKRVVHCDEAPKGDHMSEDFKSLTGGGEMLTGRSPARRPESFVNTVMLWITSNNEPLWGRDEAARSRYRLIRVDSIPAHLKDDNANERRRMMRVGLSEVLEIGVALRQHYGEIPESSETIINEAIEEENEGISYEVSRWFCYKQGNQLDAGAVKNWAKKHGHNYNRVSDCLEKLGPQLELVDGKSLKVEKKRVRVGGANSKQMTVWSNLHLSPIPVNFSSQLDL